MPFQMFVISCLSILSFLLMISTISSYYLSPSTDSESWAMLTSHRSSFPKCMNIPSNLSLCSSIQYTTMRLPNLLNHETLAEVAEQAAPWMPLLRLNCHPDTQLFLCSLFAPVCLITVDQEIFPCRSLCLVVQNGCENRMRQYGFPWPEMLNCDKYPVDNNMCIQPVISNQHNKTCLACSQVSTFENILDHFCRSQIVLKAKFRSIDERRVNIRRARSLKRERNGHRLPGFRNLDIWLSDDNDTCPCTLLRSGNRQSALRQRYLIMASSSNVTDKYVASLILPWRKREKVPMLTSSSSNSNGPFGCFANLIAIHWAEKFDNEPFVVLDRSKSPTDDSNTYSDLSDLSKLVVNVCALEYLTDYKQNMHNSNGPIGVVQILLIAENCKMPGGTGLEISHLASLYFGCPTFGSHDKVVFQSPFRRCSSVISVIFFKQ